MTELVPSPSPRRSFVLLATLGLCLPGITIHAAPLPSVQKAKADLAATAPSEWIDEEITVTATRNARRVADTPVTVDILTAKEIERQQASDTVDLIQYLPGIYVDQEGSRLGSNGFNIRGIGGNRVLTLIDGVPNAEQFDFGPLAIHQYGVDLGMLARVEVVRSAGSALYGSDALGGVVSLVTKGPDDYLALVDDDAYVGSALGYDGRSDETRLHGAFAAKRDSFGFSIFASGWQGEARDNQGQLDSPDALRTTPNPQDRTGAQLLGKLVWSGSPQTSTQFTVEGFDSTSETDVISGRTVQSLGPMFGPGVTYDIATEAFDADDRQSRVRLSLSQGRQSSTGDGWIDRIDWRVFGVRDRTRQDTVEIRNTTIGGGFFGPLTSTPAELRGTYDFDQDSLGGEATLSKGLALQSSDHLITWGLAANEQSFDMFRDRQEADDQGAFAPQSGYPTKYFPKSDVLEVGRCLQDEIRLASGRVTLVPGIRYDLYRLDPSQSDRVYLEGNLGTPLPVEMSNDAVSPRLGATFAITPETIAFAQYARGFRAPPFSEVNNGFTNVSFGYTTLPNPNLEPETSDNFELGLRRQGQAWGGSLVYFDNRYDDFIETVTIGVNPANGLLEYQPQNVHDVRIHGVELGAHGRILSWLEARSALSWSEGESGITDEPLNSVAPHQAVLGLRVLPNDRRWGGEVNAILTQAKDKDVLDTTTVDQFAPPSSQVVDVSAFVDLSKSLRFEFGVYNATDETYWNWGAVRGVAASSPTLDRYTSPGRSVVMTVRFQR